MFGKEIFECWCYGVWVFDCGVGVEEYDVVDVVVVGCGGVGCYCVGCCVRCDVLYGDGGRRLRDGGTKEEWLLSVGCVFINKWF